MTPFSHMDTVAVTTLMGRPASTGQDLDRGWQDALAKITGHDAALGGDAIGQAIRGAYEPAHTTLRAAAVRVPRGIALTLAGGSLRHDVHFPAYAEAVRILEALLVQRP